MKKKCLLMFLAFIILCPHVSAQLYTGLSGLINTPSAEMYNEGDARVGCYFMNKHFTPDRSSGTSLFSYQGEKYNTMDFYISITPFKWVELGYTFTLFKTLIEGYNKPAYNQKDRYISIKLNPLREGKYHPAIAVGSNDCIGSFTKIHGMGGSGAGYFANYYAVATKHFNVDGHIIGANLAYRYCPTEYGKNRDGVIGGVTWRPSWVPNMRAMAEYTGKEINVGLDCILWKHLILQACLQDGRYFNGGACFTINLF